MKFLSISPQVKEFVELRVNHTKRGDAESNLQAAAILENLLPDEFKQILEKARKGLWDEAESLWVEANKKITSV